MARHYEIELACRGDIDPVTGYLFDIKDLDRTVRTHAVPVIADACANAPTSNPSTVLARFFPALAAALPGGLESVRWKLTPYYSLQMQTNSPGSVLLRQKFDFAAAHRLHVPSLSEEENRRRFGKCNNAGGHGHNYQFEPSVRLTLDARGNTGFSLQDLERLVEESIIARFDHKHLNRDTPEFAEGTGVNPSVENIARIFHGLLSQALAARGATLDSITVWETDRTCATYPA